MSFLSPEATRVGLLCLARQTFEAELAAQWYAQARQLIGALPGVRAAVLHMLGRIGTGGALGVAGSQVLGLKDQAVALLRETPGLQLPNDLLLYAKTMSYVFGLGAALAPEVDLMQVSLPHLLRFLGERE